MSKARNLVVSCDHPGCPLGAVVNIASTIANARTELKSLGWVITRAADYCPQHGERSAQS